MNAKTTPEPSTIGEARERRRRRAAVARRLLAVNNEALAEVDWDTLDTAPGWLALPDAQMQPLMRQIGAVVCAAQIRLWIDGARIGAAREALGDTFLRALAAQRDLPSLPREMAPQTPIETAQDVAAGLQAAGTSILLAAVRSFALRRAASAAFGGVTPASMAVELALSLIQRAHALAVQCNAAPTAAGGRS